MSRSASTGASRADVARQRGRREGRREYRDDARVRVEREHGRGVVHGVVAAGQIDARGRDPEALRGLHNLGRAAGEADKIAAE